MKTPTDLSHKPFISVDSYSEIDGQFANKTDAKALSLGYAQYNDPYIPRIINNDTELSLKVFRYVNGRWSPQSEELPPHRVLDLAILLLRTLVQNQSEILMQSSLAERMMIHAPGCIDKVLAYCRRNKQYLLPRIEELKYLLDTMDYKGILDNLMSD